MDFQIRIRVDESFTDVSYIRDWLDAALEGFAFEHNKPGNHHYHIYLFGLDRDPDAMRRRLGKHIPEKERYMVGTTCGGKKKMSLTPQGAYQYGTTKDLLLPIWVKGFNEAEMTTFHESAAEHYKPIPVTEVIREEHYIVRPDRVWERLRTHVNDYADMNVARIKSKIAADYLNNGKAIPRSADLHRYATSLYYLNKYRHNEAGDVQIPDTALEAEYS